MLYVDATLLLKASPRPAISGAIYTIFARLQQIVLARQVHMRLGTFAVPT